MSKVPSVDVKHASSSPLKKAAKVAKSPVVKKSKAKATHPPTGEMVVAAVKTLKERGGSSLQAIKKYLTVNYKVDCEKLAPFIKKFLISAVVSGQLLQKTGKGASGSFKLPAVTKKAPDVKKVVKKPVAAKKGGVKKTSNAKWHWITLPANTAGVKKIPNDKWLWITLPEKKAAVVKAPLKKSVFKAKVKAVAKPKAKATHPPTGEMVVAAVKTLKERGGSSLQAIKKYLTANYKVDCEKLAPFIKKFLKSAVVSGQLLQTKGKGASGSFKLPAVTKKTPDVKKVVKKPVAAKKAGVKKMSNAKCHWVTLPAKETAVVKKPFMKPVLKAKVQQYYPKK